MQDSQLLQWVIDRLINVHGELPNVDYILHLKQLQKKLANYEENQSLTLREYV